MSLLNPYKLLGVTHTSTLSEVKRSYYQWALLCHPDKGGTEEEMIVIQQAYEYIRTQLENCEGRANYEELEQEFTNFCKEQEKTIPPFRKIWESSEEYQTLRNFNDYFDSQVRQDPSYKLFQQGYGALMDTEETTLNQDSAEIAESPPTYTYPETEEPRMPFTEQLVVYKDPVATPEGYGKHTRLDVVELADFSCNRGTDYKRAFQAVRLQNPRDTVDSIQYKPQTLEELQSIRETFQSQLSL